MRKTMLCLTLELGNLLLGQLLHHFVSSSSVLNVRAENELNTRDVTRQAPGQAGARMASTGKGLVFENKSARLFSKSVQAGFSDRAVRKHTRLQLPCELRITRRREHESKEKPNRRRKASTHAACDTVCGLRRAARDSSTQKALSPLSKMKCLMSNDRLGD
jgi:hypothetical protein